MSASEAELAMLNKEISQGEGIGVL